MRRCHLQPRAGTASGLHQRAELAARVTQLKPKTKTHTHTHTKNKKHTHHAKSWILSNPFGVLVKYFGVYKLDLICKISDLVSFCRNGSEARRVHVWCRKVKWPGRSHVVMNTKPAAPVICRHHKGIHEYVNTDPPCIPGRRRGETHKR